MKFNNDTRFDTIPEKHIITLIGSSVHQRMSTPFISNFSYSLNERMRLRERLCGQEYKVDFSINKS